MRYPGFFAACLIALLCTSVVPAQTGEHPGIAAFRAGKTDEAISLLKKASSDDEFKSKAEVWNTLGLAYLEKSERKNARKSFEKAVELQPMSNVFRINLALTQLMTGQTDKAADVADIVLTREPGNLAALFIRGKAALWTNDVPAAERYARQMLAASANDARGYLLLSEATIAKVGKSLADGGKGGDQVTALNEAAAALRSGIPKITDKVAVVEVEAELQTLEAFSDRFTRTPVSTPRAALPPPEPGVTPLKVISKTAPRYTPEARTNSVEGKIAALVIFGASGRIEGVMLLNRLGSGLDESVINAVRAIKFEPQTKDGKPVTVVKRIEYSFAIK